MSALNLPTFQPRPRKRPAPRPVPSLEDPAAFARWLQASAPGAGIGRGREACQCPLALWLRVQGAPNPQVHCHAYELGDGVSRPLPRWAAAFRREFDRWWTSEDGVATAADCLECLGSVARELGAKP